MQDCLPQERDELKKFREQRDVLNGTIGGKWEREPGQSVGIAQAGWDRPMINVFFVFFFVAEYLFFITFSQKILSNIPTSNVQAHFK